MKTLFILKFDTCVSPRIQHLKHTEPLMLAQWLCKKFESIYIFGDPTSNDEPIYTLPGRSRVFIVNDSALWSSLLSNASYEDCRIILWQGSTNALMHCTIGQRDALCKAFDSFVKTNAKKFTLTTDLRFDFDKELVRTLNVPQFAHYSDAFNSVKSTITHICQNKHTHLSYIGAKEYVHAPLQVIAAIQQLRLMYAATDIQVSQIEKVTTSNVATKQHVTCASCAGFTYLDQYRRDVIRKYVLDTNDSLLITSYFDDTILAALKCAKGNNVSIQYKVPYYIMSAMMSSAKYNIVVGDQLYVKALLLPNRWVEGVLASCNNVLIDYDKSIFEPYIDDVAKLDVLPAVSSTLSSDDFIDALKQYDSDAIQHVQHELLANMVNLCYNTLIQTLR